ncbi:MAG TPA: EamA family transporter [Vicinamibacterales bacterium]|nr:EamA family transporter [Vicinamibacterales bacterium]
MSPVVRRRAYIAFAAVCLIWGTTYLAIKIALETIPPMAMGGIRYTTAGVVLALALWMRGTPLPPRSSWPSLAFIGFFMLGLGNGGVTYGEQFVPSGLAAVLIATSPFWMTGIESLWPGGERLRLRQIVGLIVGFGGILVLVWPDLLASADAGSRFGAGVLALQLACVGWAIGSTYAKRFTHSTDVLASAALQMVFGGAWMLLFATVAGEWPRLAFNGKTTLALAYLTVAGSIAAYTAYAYALKHLPVSTVSLYTYVNPVIAVALGTLLLGEPFGARMLVAAAIIALGILIVSVRQSGQVVGKDAVIVDPVPVRRAS